jgi:hypothetical protein
MTMMGINKTRETRTSTTRVNNFTNLTQKRSTIQPSLPLRKKCNKVMFTTGTSPRFADDGSCQHHLEHALQVQAESAQSFVSFCHQKNEMKDGA